MQYMRDEDSRLIVAVDLSHHPTVNKSVNKKLCSSVEGCACPIIMWSFRMYQIGGSYCVRYEPNKFGQPIYYRVMLH